MKSIRTDPRNHAAEGDERIRTAVPAPSDVSTYDDLLRALEWYAERRNYVPAAPPVVPPPKHLMETDAWDGLGPGARARAALAGAEADRG